MLEDKDLLPFRRAVAMRVEMMMTAHVLYPAIDPEMPATLSATALQGLLRQNMAYDGVVIN